MTKALLMAGAAALIAASTATAADGGAGFHAVTIEGPHARMTVLPAATKHSEISAPETDAGLVTIFSSMASKYPKGEYWCCTGYNVMGSQSGVGEQWMGAAFTPDADHTVTRIEVGVGYSEQGPNGVVISLNEDKGGMPGKALKTWNVSGLPTFGACCVVVAETDKSGIPITAGKQYWLVLSTNSKEAQTVDGWNVSDADQVDQANLASFDGTIWHTFQAAPGVAFAVKGSN